MTVADKKKLKPSETSAIAIASPIRTQEGDFQIFDGAESGIANKIDEFYLFSYSVQTKISEMSQSSPTLTMER